MYAMINLGVGETAERDVKAFYYLDQMDITG